MQLQLVRQSRGRSRSRGKCEKQLLKLQAESRSWLNCCAAFWSFIFTKLVHYELVLIRLAVVLHSAHVPARGRAGSSSSRDGGRDAGSSCKNISIKTKQSKSNSCAPQSVPHFWPQNSRQRQRERAEKQSRK